MTRIIESAWCGSPRSLAIHATTLFRLRTAWRFLGLVVPVSVKDPEGWDALEIYTVVLETVGLDVDNGAQSVVLLFC
jgi:hypothetical protein